MDSVEFPKLGVLPKTETGALAFVSQNPEYDGRGTIVAILDTGCDPGADGLQITTDGKPKFVDVIDSTGSGDVNTSSQVEISSLINNNILVSPLTKNKLQLNEQWIKENTNSYFNVGQIRAYHLFPKPLKGRIEKKRNEKFANKLAKSLEALQAEIKAKTEELANAKDDVSVEDKRALKEEIEDLNTLSSELAKEKNSGSGPVFDVVVWNNGKQWNAVMNTIAIDAYINCTDLDELAAAKEKKPESKTEEDDDDEESLVFVKKDEDGDAVFDISGLCVLTNYRVGLKYGTISKETMLNYVLNIYDEGKLVSVVVPGGSHGTHVAGIVGAYYKDDASKNGVAPGCQFVSIKIGDTRLGTMETNQGLMRALYHIRENKCDLVNMSYGEPTTTVKTGCFPKGVESLVWKYGTIFISSAGNDGPCLSTAGAPQSSTDAIIGIGAMFSPQMVQSEYGIVQKGEDGQNVVNHYEAYSWSSRGPTMDGAIGVKIMCPGGAIAPVPEYTLNANQLMNGTSMSSPNACGNVSLLLSALKQQGIKYSPYGIETALINSANDNVLGKIDVTARGYGLLQIAAAHEYCVKNQEFISGPVSRFEIGISGPNHKNARGIYVREAGIKRGAISYGVFVTPKFHEDVSNEVKVKYQFKCALKTDCNWIEPAPFTLIATDGRYFEIKVDAFKVIQQNAMRYTPVFRGYILGLNNDDLSAGPLFRIPVTICNPIKYPLSSPLRSISSGYDYYGSAEMKTDEDGSNNNKFLYKRRDRFTTGRVSRLFHEVPTGASMARVSIKCVSTNDNKQMRFAFCTLYKKGSGEQVKFERWCRLGAGDELSTGLQRVEPNTILETTLCQYALSYGESVVDWSVEFVAPQITVNDYAINMNNGDQFGMITLRTADIPCTDEANKINPTVKFDTFVAYYPPKFATINKNTIAELGDVDISKNNDERVYTMNIEYEFDQKIAGSKSMIKFPLMDDLLYESLYDGNFWQLFDSNKQLIGFGEAFEQSTEIAKQKGYTLILQLRSSDLGLLNKVKDSLMLRVDTVLAAKNQMSCDVYSSRLGMLSGSGKITSPFAMSANSNKDLYISAPSVSKLEIKEIDAGCQLLGYLKLNKEAKNELRPKFRSNGSRGSSSLCVPITCAISSDFKAPSSKEKLPEIADEKDEKDEEEKLSMEEKQRDAMIDWMNKKLKQQAEKEQAFETYGKALLQKYADHLPLLLLKLEVYRESENIKQVMEISDEILSRVDLTELAAFLGRKVADKTEAEYKRKSKKYKEQKQAVVEALKAKLNAIKRELSGANKQEKEEKKKKGDAILDFERVAKQDLKAFEEVYKQLGEWMDVEKDKKLFDLNLWYNLQRGLLAKSLLMINERMNNGNNGKDEKAASKENVEMKLKLVKKFLPSQQWRFLVEQYECDLAKKFPADYTPF